MMEQERNFHVKYLLKVLCLFLTAMLFPSCSHAPVSQKIQPSSNEQKTFVLQEISPVQAKIFLSQLGMTDVYISLKQNAVIVGGSTKELQKAGILLDLVDTKDEYVIEILAPVSAARIIPANDQIAMVLGDVSIGTFAGPPHRKASLSGEPDRRARAIIDIYGESVVAIIPARLRQQVLSIIKSDQCSSRQVVEAINDPAEAETAHKSTENQVIDTTNESDNAIEPAVAEEFATSGTLSTQLSSDLSRPQVHENKPDTQIISQTLPLATTEVVASRKTEINTIENFSNSLAE